MKQSVLSGRPPKPATINLLAGLATCGVCGGGLVVETGEAAPANQTSREGDQGETRVSSEDVADRRSRGDSFDRGSLSPTYKKPFDLFARATERRMGGHEWSEAE